MYIILLSFHNNQNDIGSLQLNELNFRSNDLIKFTQPVCSRAGNLARITVTPRSMFSPSHHAVSIKKSRHESSPPFLSQGLKFSLVISK